MGESILRRVRRVARFIHDKELVGRDALHGGPSLAAFALQRGLNVRTIHHVHARQHGERIALIDDRQALTYFEADQRISQICRAFASVGIGRGDRVVLCMENRVEYLLFWFAGFRAGIATVHASYRSTADELRYLLEHSKARAIVCSSKTSGAVREVAQAGPKVEVVVVDDEAVHPLQHQYPRWCAQRDADFFVSDRDAPGDNVVYTSGTTGKPKGAVRNFTDVGVAELSRVAARLPIKSGDRHLIVCPMYHSGAQAFATMMTSLGCTLVLRPKFEAVDTLAALSRWRIHSAFVVPTMIRRLVSLDRDVKAQHPIHELRALVSGAAAFPHALREEAVEMFGPSAIWDFYGATELGWLTLIDGNEMMRKPGSLGRPLEGHEMRITGPDRAPLGAGQVGTIWARTGQTMQAYLDDQAATDDARDGGWITVDDLGYLDDEGYLFLCGRDRDMVISGGINIYPVEIEEVVSKAPGVTEVGVIGVEDDDLGERLVAVYAGTATPEDLEAHARAQLASHKVPKRWERVPELPRNPTGKILKRELRERFG